jgi:hypothetical protein
VKANWFLPLTALGLLTVPYEALACSYCGLSIVNLAFPFMWTGIWVLGVWRILSLILGWQHLVQRSTRSIVVELVGILFLLMSARQGGFFLYLAGAFVFGLARSLRTIPRDWRQPTTRWVLALNLATLFVLIPIATRSYVAYAKQDDLDRLRLYVYPGTGQSRSLTMAIARDHSVDVSRIRPMLESPVDEDAMKAFELLCHRASKSDLLALKDIVLKIPEQDYNLDTPTSARTAVWLPFWLHAVVGHDVATHAELEAWIEGEKAP